MMGILFVGYFMSGRQLLVHVPVVRAGELRTPCVLLQYGLDTTEFSSNPTEARRFAQPNQAPTSTEEQQQSRCTIM